MKAKLAWYKTANFRILYWCFSLVILWRILLELLNQSIVPLMTVGPGGSGVLVMRAGVSGLSRWVHNWDASWYSSITLHGYVIVDNFKTNESIVFFPLFPFLVKWISDITRIKYQVVGLGLNLVFTTLAVYFIFKLTVLWANEKGIKNANRLGQLSAIFLLINPAAFFFSAYYAEALLVMLIIASIYFAFRDRYLLASLLAGLATAAKSIGVVLLPALILLFLYRNHQSITVTIKAHWKKLISMCVLSVSGIVAFMVYQWVKYGDAIAFIKVEKYWNRNISGFFLKSIWNNWYRNIFSPHYFFPLSYLYAIYVMAIPLSIILISIYLLYRHKFVYLWLVVMCLAAVLIPLSTGTLLSINRYVLVLAPLICYLFVHIYAVGSNKVKQLILAAGSVSLFCMVICTLIFLSYRFAG